MLADFHMHTNFSTDADRSSTPESMIEGAIQKGLRTICITDHQDYDFPSCEDDNEFHINYESYFATLRELQEQYKGKIEVLIGIEFGVQPHLGNLCQKCADRYPFDFIIGSTHVFDGMDPYYPGYFGNRTDEEGYRRAFEIILENTKNVTAYDVAGHLDYVVRYGKEQTKEYSYQRYADLIEEILKTLIEKGKGIELNTAGLKYGLGFAHPHMDILKKYRELGGEIITIGSDAHKPEHIAYEFEKVKGILETSGFKYYTEFRQRKPHFRQL